ncbi:SRPBCC family protein [Silvanigrella aquatica]|uniref:Polyketide cyclase n=1 Tax=Silvanigrella aquatica TaxID=1915309 RepID=A0A1L4D2B0_9BACT|nr:SRPBCC family protein [Silvanigrella aquatica]APJ04339.1 polyketide cyclase [Silvanigrella aquatica]
MIRKIFLLIFILITIFLSYVSMQPSNFKIVRELKINAPPETVFNYVNDLRKFTEWNPWSKIDPQAKQIFKGPISGKGASYSWEGNNDVGTGSMTIIETQPYAFIKIQLDMIKPFSDTNNVEFSFKADGNATNISWTIKGKANFISKLFCVFIDRDKIIGSEFEKGLQNLKKLAENIKK